MAINYRVSIISLEIERKQLDHLEGDLTDAGVSKGRGLPEAAIHIRRIKSMDSAGRKPVTDLFLDGGYRQSARAQSHISSMGHCDRGRMKIIINKKTRLCTSGDQFLILVQAKNSAPFPTKARLIDLFQEKTMYKPK